MEFLYSYNLTSQEKENFLTDVIQAFGFENPDTIQFAKLIVSGSDEEIFQFYINLFD